MNLTLRKRIIIPFVTLLLLSIGTIGGTALYLANKSLNSALEAEMLEEAHSLLLEVENTVNNCSIFIEELGSDADATAALAGQAESERAQKRIQQRFQTITSLQDNLDSLALADKDGNLLVSSTPSLAGTINVKSRGYFQTAMKGQPNLSHGLSSLSTNGTIVVNAFPVKEGNTVLGVMFAVIDIDKIARNTISNVQILDTGYAFLCDSRGIILAHPNRELVLKADLNEYPWGRQILNEKRGRVVYDWEGDAKQAFFSTSDTLGWTLATTAREREIYAPARRIAITIACTALATILLGLAISWLVARRIANPLSDIASRLGSSATATARISDESSANSHSLAQGASEQAAAIEETSSSLVELDTRSRANTSDAHNAKELASQTRESVDLGAEAMSQMVAAINQIKNSGDSIATIIKSIDEISFQTNLLALNAAVEAARAGEAGAGFSVVAEEVRMLAQRSAAAAHETSDMINDVVESTHKGVKISEEVSAVLSSIKDRTGQLDTIVAQVFEASNAQSSSISQLNQTMTQMGQVTQNNATASEETAANADHLRTHTVSLRKIVAEIELLVDGKATDLENHVKPSASDSRNWQTSPQAFEIGTQRNFDHASANFERFETADSIPGSDRN